MMNKLHLTVIEALNVDVYLTLSVWCLPGLLALGHNGLPQVPVQGLRQQLYDLPELLASAL